MPAFKYILWGIIQGVTEFIPVSSSGHLVIVPRLLGVEAPDLIFDVALHMGTLAAVLIYFRKDIKALFTTQKRLGLLVMAGTLPLIAAGLLFEGSVKIFFEKPNVVGWMLILNGGILLTGHLKIHGAKSGFLNGRDFWRAIIVGIAQPFALMPGISRSGITITAALLCGLEKKDAYRFSFLLFIPAAILALLYALREASSGNYAVDINMLLIGVISSAISGMIALKVLYSVLERAKLYIPGIYCVILGLLTVFVF